MPASLAGHRDFLNVSTLEIFQLVLAANYMDIKDLMDLTCAKVALLCASVSLSVSNRERDSSVCAFVCMCLYLARLGRLQVCAPGRMR